MTIIVDDAGSGDLLFGVVIGAYREETSEFKYDIIDVRFYQDRFCKKEYLNRTACEMCGIASKPWSIVWGLPRNIRAGTYRSFALWGVTRC